MQERGLEFGHVSSWPIISNRPSTFAIKEQRKKKILGGFRGELGTTAFHGKPGVLYGEKTLPFMARPWNPFFPLCVFSLDFKFSLRAESQQAAKVYARNLC